MLKQQAPLRQEMMRCLRRAAAAAYDCHVMYAAEGQPVPMSLRAAAAEAV
jgi:hypothetical protein